MAQDEIDEYMTKYAPSSSTDDDDGNGDEDDPDAQQDYAAFNAWLDQLSKGEAAPSRPAVSRPPPKDAKPEADAPQVGGSVEVSSIWVYGWWPFPGFSGITFWTCMLPIVQGSYDHM